MSSTFQKFDYRVALFSLYNWPFSVCEGNTSLELLCACKCRSDKNIPAGTKLKEAIGGVSNPICQQKLSLNPICCNVDQHY